MSIEHLTGAIHAPLRPHARKLVLIALSNYSDQDGRCWPSVQSIADIAQLDRRSVQRHLHELEEAGWVRREPSYQDGRQRCNVYRLQIEAIRGATAQPSRGDSTTAPGRHDCHPGGDTRDAPGGDSTTAPGGDTRDTPGTPIGTPIGTPSTSESASRSTDAAGESVPVIPLYVGSQGQALGTEQPQGSGQAPERHNHAQAGQLQLTEQEPDPTAIRIPAREYGYIDVPESKVQEWERAFPALDVRQELEGLKQWATDNPARRKKNIIQWCSRRLSAKQEQGRGQARGAPPPRSAEAVRRHNQQVAQRWASGSSDDERR